TLPAAILEPGTLHEIRNRLTLTTASTQRELVGPVNFEFAPYDLFVHLNPDGLAVLEVEPAPKDAGPPSISLSDLRALLTRAAARDSVDAMLHEASVGLQGLTGFDRVMAYRFLPNGDGEIVAEARRSAAVESFLGLRYPAWDIPSQSRAIQVRNTMRVLHHIDEEPIPILAARPDAPDLDLSFAHLRGLSPVHAQYLRNMEVGGSMTISLVIRGRLWGMFALHHREPRLVRSETRIACEVFGQMAALIIDQKQELEAAAHRARTERARRTVALTVRSHPQLPDGAGAATDPLLEVLDADGVAVVGTGVLEVSGSVPSAEAIRRLASADGEPVESVHSLESIREQHPDLEPEALGASAGCLIVRTLAPEPLQLLFFRDAVERKIQWSGRPEKQLAATDYGTRLMPRASFATYLEERRDMCDPWSELDLRVAEDLKALLAQLFAQLREQDAHYRSVHDSEQRRRQEVLTAELSHRVKNILALVRSMSRQTRSSAESFEEYTAALEARIASLAQAHDLATTAPEECIALRSLFELELAAWLQVGGQRVIIDGPAVGLRPDVVPMLALVIHELATNAAKYGALSNGDGVLRICWQLDDGVRVEWREVGGPNVRAPEDHGFGHTLITRAVPFELGGSVELTFDPAGVRCLVELPASKLTELTNGRAHPVTLESDHLEKFDQPLELGHVLVVEDNLLIGMDLAETLRGLGAESVEIVGSLDDGFDWIAKHPVTVSILDMNLGDSLSFDLARELERRGVPLLFVTGYGSDAVLPADIRHHPVITKPVSDRRLRAQLQRLLTP
ncbi:MAG: HWE histidine kinase domain-containing protein, partial [Planctomycetota bacterium]